MAIMSANESRAMDNYPFDLKSNKEFVAKDNGGTRSAEQSQNYKSNGRYTSNWNRARDYNNQTRDYNSQKRDWNSQTRDNNSQKRDNSNPHKGTYTKQTKPLGDRPTDSRNHNSRSYQKNYLEDMDEDIEYKASRSHRTNDSKAKLQQDQPLDKLEAFKRLEREKKIMQKKQREEDAEKKRRPAPKQRRSAKSDLTKDYIYGLYDEDEAY